MNIQELRQKYPDYNDMSDQQFADAFHAKFYSDIPKNEFYKTLGIVGDDQKKTSLWEDVKSGLAGAVNTLDTVGTLGAYANIKAGMEGDQVLPGIQDELNSRIESRKKWANPNNLEQGIGGTVISAIPQILTAPLSPAERAKSAYESGESAGRATAIGSVDAAGQAVGLVAPGLGKTLATQVLGGAVSNVAQDYITSKIEQDIAKTDRMKKYLEPTTESLTAAAVLGSGFAGVHALGNRQAKSTSNKNSVGHDPVAALDDTPGIPESKLYSGEQAAPIDVEYMNQRRGLETARQPELPQEEVIRRSNDEVLRQMVDERNAREQATQGPEYPVDERNRRLIAESNQKYFDERAPRLEELEQRQKLEEAEKAQKSAQEQIDLRQKNLENDVTRTRNRQQADEIINSQREASLLEDKARRDSEEAARLKAIEDEAKARKAELDNELTRANNRAEAESIIARQEQERAELARVTQELEVQKAAQAERDASMSHFSGIVNPKVVAKSAAPKRQTVPVNKGDVKSSNPFGSIAGIPKSQRGGVNFDAVSKGISGGFNKLKTIFDNNKGLRGLKDSYLANYGRAEDILANALKATKDIKLSIDIPFTKHSIGTADWKAGMSNTSVFHDHPLLREMGNLFQTAAKRTDVLIKNFVEPAQDALVTMRKKSPEQYDQLYRLFMKELTNGKTYSPEQMIKAGFTGEQIDVYQSMRRMFKQAAIEQNKVLESKGLKPLSELDHYIASRRIGDYTQYFYDTKGRLVWMTRDTTNGKAKATAEWIHSNVPDIDKTKTQLDIIKTTGHVEDPAASYSSMLMRFGDENIAKQIKELMVAKDTLAGVKAFQQFQHFKRKTGIRGFEGDRPWKSLRENADDLFAQQMHYAKNAFSWSELNKAGSIASEVLRNEELVKKSPNAVAHANQYMDRYLGRGDGIGRNIDSALGHIAGFSGASVRKLSNSWKTLWTTQKMVTNTGNAVQNLVQPVNTLPYHQILSDRGYKHDAGKTFVLGMADTVAGLHYHYSDGKSIPFSQLGLEATKYAEDNLILSRSPYDEQVTIESTHVPVVSQLEHVGREINQATNKPANFAAFMSFVHHLDQSGKFAKTKEGRMQMFQEAERWTNASMVDPRPGERPFIVQDTGAIGSAAYGLQSYIANKFNSLSGFYQHGKETGNWKPLGTACAVDIATAGVRNSIPVAVFMSLANFINQQFDSDVVPDMRKMLMNLGDGIGDLASKVAGDKAGQMAKEAVDTGIPGVAIGHAIGDRAMDLGPRFGGMPSLPGIGMVTDTASQIKGVAEGLSSGDLGKVAATIAPTGVAKGLLETSGLYSRDNQVDMSPTSGKPTGYKRDDVDNLMRRIGVPSLREQQARESMYEFNRLSKLDRDRVNTMTSNIATDILRNKSVDQAKVQRLFKLYPDQAGNALRREVDKQVMEWYVNAETRNAIKQKSLADIDRFERVYGRK